MLVDFSSFRLQPSERQDRVSPNKVVRPSLSSAFRCGKLLLLSQTSVSPVFTDASFDSALRGDNINFPVRVWHTVCMAPENLIPRVLHRSQALLDFCVTSKTVNIKPLEQLPDTVPHTADLEGKRRANFRRIRPARSIQLQGSLQLRTRQTIVCRDASRCLNSTSRCQS